MTAVGSSETTMNLYQNLWRHIPEDNSLQTILKFLRKLNGQCNG